MKTFYALFLGTVMMSASAFGQLSQTATFSGTPDFSQSLTFNKYTGNLSDLIGITVSYSLNIAGGSYSVDNDSPVSVNNIQASFGANLSLSSSDVALLTSNFQPVITNANALNTATFNLGPDQGDGTATFSTSPIDSATLYGKDATTSGSGSIGNFAWSQFVGAGTFNINALASQQGSLSYNSGISTLSTPLDAKGTVTVTYLTVPEPSGSLLLGLTCAGALLRRKRQVA